MKNMTTRRNTNSLKNLFTYGQKEGYLKPELHLSLMKLELAIARGTDGSYQASKKNKVIRLLNLGYHIGITEGQINALLEEIALPGFPDPDKGSELYFLHRLDAELARARDEGGYVDAEHGKYGAEGMADVIIENDFLIPYPRKNTEGKVSPMQEADKPGAKIIDGEYYFVDGDEGRRI